MNDFLQQVTRDVEQAILEVVEAGHVRAGQLFVIGCSTSEVLGHKIGTSGTIEAAAAIFAGVEAARRVVDFHPVYQCCEHLNRALVVEQVVADRYSLEAVSAVPIVKAGGSMATYAFRHLADPVVVEHVRAHAGIDIGDTMIGMHLRPVAVPYRAAVRQIGEAHLTTAFTRPKLIGGQRAVYRLEEA